MFSQENNEDGNLKNVLLMLPQLTDILLSGGLSHPATSALTMTTTDLAQPIAEFLADHQAWEAWWEIGAIE
jgi:hypothetical protein